MVHGTNELGEQSIYNFNGLDVLVEQTWIVKKNAYGYTNMSENAMVEGEVVVDAATGKKQKKQQLDAEVVQANSNLNKTSTIVKSFVIDYTSETHYPLMEYETNGLTYRYVYGNDRLSVDISDVLTSSGNLLENKTHIRLYYHQDYLGTTDYLTSPVSLKVTSWTHYNEWGEITHNAVLKSGVRELDLVKNYTGHEYDAVLDQFYAKYRMYDASDRRFTTIDPIRDGLNWYIYVENNPVMWVDPLGLAIASTDVHVYNGEDDAAVTMFVFVYDSAGVARPIANHKTIDGELMVSLNEIYTYLTEDITGHKSDKTATLNRTVNSRSLTYELNINGYYAKFVCDGKFDVKTTTATKSKNNDIQVSYKVDSGDVLVNLNDFLSVYGRGKNAATLNLYPYKVYYVSSHTTEHSQYTELVSGLELLDGYEKAKLKYPALDADLWLTQAKAAQHDVDFVESPAVLWNSLEDVATQLMAANAIGKLLTPDYNLPGKGVPEVDDFTGKISSSGSNTMNPTEAAKKITEANRTGSGLSSDTYHRSASYLTQEQLAQGKTFTITGGDGVQRTLLQVNGVVNGKNGVFEYILDPSGVVTHQRFIPNGVITGVPNQVIKP